MKDLRPALRAFLLADADIAAAVGSSRVFPVVLPQEQNGQTSIVYTRISGRGDHHMQGPSGLDRVRVQVDAWAVEPDAADELARAVKARLDGYLGPMPMDGSPPVEVTVQGVFLDSARDDYDSNAKMHRVSQDFMIWFEER